METDISVAIPLKRGKSSTITSKFPVPSHLNRNPLKAEQKFN